MRRRAEVVVGVLGGDPDDAAARVARVEQDQRERSLSSPSVAPQSDSMSPSSRNDAVPDGGKACVGVDEGEDEGEGEAGCEAA
jgi:hypothetical protein